MQIRTCDGLEAGSSGGEEQLCLLAACSDRSLVRACLTWEVADGAQVQRQCGVVDDYAMELAAQEVETQKAEMRGKYALVEGPSKYAEPGRLAEPEGEMQG